MGKALIIGCGGVASVTIHKCCQNSDVFEEICIASRTKSKCDALKEKLSGGKTKITTAQVDADDVNQLINLINEFKPDVVINLALPYQDLTIMDACLATKVHYVDTANYEPLDTAKFEYKWQWAYRERFEKAGITALLGSGFDPGVTGVFSAYAMKHHFDEIDVMFFQQLHFCFFLFLFVLFSNREEIERYTETFCHMLKVGMVTYNQRNFHIPFSGRVACQHIEQAMGQFGNKYGHFGFYIREIKTEFHFIFLGIQGFKIIFYFIFRNKEILYFPFYTHEKYIFYMVHILV